MLWEWLCFWISSITYVPVGTTILVCLNMLIEKAIDVIAQVAYQMHFVVGIQATGEGETDFVLVNYTSLAVRRIDWLGYCFDVRE